MSRWFAAGALGLVLSLTLGCAQTSDGTPRTIPASGSHPDTMFGDALEPTLSGPGHTQSSVPRWGVSKQLQVTGNGTARESVHPAVDALIAPNGDFFATQNEHVKHYSSAGKLLRVIGRNGDGPGEFRRVARIGISDDTLWAFDIRHQRISVFDNNGAFISSTPNPAPTTRMELFAVLASGRFLTVEMEDNTSSSSLETSYVVRLHDIGGAVRQELSRLDGTRAFRRVELDGGGSIGVRVPYADRPLVGASPNGRHSVVVEVPTPTSSTASFLVRRFDENGDPVSAIRQTLPGARPNRNLVDFLVEEQVKSLASQRFQHPQLASKIREVMWPPSAWVPAFIRVFAEDDGHVWLQSSDQVTWLRLDHESKMQGTIEMPRSTVVLTIGGLDVWCLEFDDDGEPSFVKYHVTRPGEQ